MAYRKFLVDNPTCSRRFHLNFDDESPNLELVEVKCPFCDIVVFHAQNHPEVHLARQENLVKTAVLSEQTVDECAFKDGLSSQTVPELKGKENRLYQH